jgi:hypothetical protein
MDWLAIRVCWMVRAAVHKRAATAAVTADAIWSSGSCAGTGHYVLLYRCWQTYRS